MSLISATLSQLSSRIVEQEASESGRQRSEVLRLVFRNPGKTLDFYKKHVDGASQKQKFVWLWMKHSPQSAYRSINDRHGVIKK